MPVLSTPLLHVLSRCSIPPGEGAVRELLVSMPLSFRYRTAGGSTRSARGRRDGLDKLLLPIGCVPRASSLLSACVSAAQEVAAIVFVEINKVKHVN